MGGRRRGLAIAATALVGALAGPSVAAAAGPVADLPVTFHVVNVNRSRVPCAADGRPYDVRGHLVGPAAALTASGPRAVTLYAHGLGYGEFFWHFKGLPGYDYATELAAAGHTSVVIDRLGYGASGKPVGDQVCLGSEADYLHQIVGALRTGAYTVTGVDGAPPSFARVALAGHSAGGFMVEDEAASFRDVDAVVVAGFSNAGPSPLALATFGDAQTRCALSTLFPSLAPGKYAYFGATPADFQAAHFYNADPAVVSAITALRARDPCGDTGAGLQAILVDLLSNISVGVPVLLVNGSNDALFPPPAGPLEQLTFLGNGDVSQITLAATGHAMTLGRTAPHFRQVVGDWLAARGF
jgi:alpha-beta hydrolase superfamily lysophospholipase